MQYIFDFQNRLWKNKLKCNGSIAVSGDPGSQIPRFLWLYGVGLYFSSDL